MYLAFFSLPPYKKYSNEVSAIIALSSLVLIVILSQKEGFFFTTSSSPLAENLINSITLYLEVK